jgi:hypothetical protein
MTNFGFQPGILDYWMLLTDWRNGSFAILLASGVLLVGYGQAQNLTRWWPVVFNRDQLPQQPRQPGVTDPSAGVSGSTLAWRAVSSLWRKCK